MFIIIYLKKSIDCQVTVQFRILFVNSNYKLKENIMLKLFKHVKVNKVLLASLLTIIILKTIGILYIPTLTA